MKKTIIELLLKSQIGVNPVCVGCKDLNKMDTTPLTPYIIPDKSTPEEERIMFIGKVGRGDGFGKKVEDNLEDVTEFGIEEFEASSWAFYSYTKEIAETYYGDFEKPSDHICFSNLVKCKNSSMNDTTLCVAKLI